MRKAKISSLIMCVIISFFIAISFILPYRSEGIGKDEWHVLDKGWLVEEKDGIMTNTLPEVKDGQVIALYSNLQTTEIMIGGQSVPAYANVNMKKIGAEAPDFWIMVELKKDFSHQTIRIECKDQNPKHHNHATLVQKIYLGNETAVIFHIWQTNIALLMLGIISVAMGIFYVLFALILSLSERKSPVLKQMFYLGSFSVGVGILVLCKNNARQFFTDNIFLGHYLSYILPMLYPVPLLSYAGVKAEGKDKKLVKAVKWMFPFVFVINSVLAATGACALERSFIFTHLFLLLMNIVLLYLAVKALISKKRDGIYYGISYILLILSSVIGILNYMSGRGTGMDMFICQGAILFTFLSGVGVTMEMSKTHLYNNQQMKKNEAKARFLANLGYELRTPMYAICGMAATLSETELSWENRNRLNIVRQSCESMSSILNDILEASGLESAERMVTEREYRLKPMLQEMVTFTGSIQREKPVSLDCHIVGVVPSAFYGDNEKISQVLQHLLEHGVKHTDSENIKLTVEFEKSGIQKGNLIFQVTDSFETETELGYVNCQKILEELDGSINRITLEGKAVIRCIVPQSILDTKPLEQIQIEELKKEEPEAALQSIKAPYSRVLVVDDNHINLQVAKAMLRRYEMDVIFADNGQEALDILQEKNVDLVFMDLRMPYMDGYETAQNIRARSDAYYQNLPIVAFTANAAEGTEKKVYEAGMDAYMVKPIHTEHLNQVLITYLPKEKQVVTDNPKDTGQQESRAFQKYGEFLSMLGDVEITDGLSYCMNKPEVYFEVLKAYATPQLMQSLEQAWNKRDIKDYNIYIHSVKSSSKNIGANKLSDMAMALEEAAKNMDMDYLDKHHDSCMAEYKKVHQTIKDAVQYMVQERASKTVKIKKLSKAEFDEYKDRLVEAFDNMDPVASREILDELSNVNFADTGIEKCIQEMKENIENYDFDEAEAALKQI